ncbi:MAG: Phenylalanine--tRNA ligase beta subunit [candidate division BRC1 bacterium ADurb.BinA364]|nr:MAG: Phenylalanine--tRNA ligase beta subunit [candidate division BRC1 bacterium ADurb.BinA364]
MPQRPVQPVATDEEMRAARSIRDLLVNFGFYEIVGPALLSRASLEPFGFAPDECILISNPLTASQEALRPSLAPAMLRAMIDNLRSGARDLRLFEVSRIYSPPSIPGEPPGEILSLCVGLCGERGDHWRHGRQPIDFFDLKSVAEHALDSCRVEQAEFAPDPPPFLHPGRAARIRWNGRAIGWLGELRFDPPHAAETPQPLYMLEMQIAPLLRAAVQPRRAPIAPKFPAVERQMSLTISVDVLAARIESVIRAQSRGLLESVRLLDIARGDPLPAQRKRMLYRLAYRAADRVLASEEVDSLFEQARRSLETELGAKVGEK